MARSVVIMTGETDLRKLLSGMRPELNAGRYVFTAVKDGVPSGVTPVVTVAEDEGLTLVVRQEEADAAGFHHDHLFVPYEHADRAVAVLEDLTRRSA